jgi:nitrate reductase gamma subunit
MKLIYALLAVLALSAMGYAGGFFAASRLFFGVIVPFAATGVFVAGIVCRVVRWSRSPVPFRIPTTCGQQKTLPWIKASRLESPSNTADVIGRMALEILCFRSLLRNTKSELRDGPRLIYGSGKLLWITALAFHWTLLAVLVRHLRFFLEPIPGFVQALANLDSVFQIAIPELYITDLILLLALAYLLLRKWWDLQVRYISLFTDYFALLLLLGLALSGVAMRHFIRVDVAGVKQLAMSLLTFAPMVPAGLHPLFFTHIVLFSTLLAYFPFSKLVHMGGVFLSPTRNLANNSRAKRHVNPWDSPVHVHTYQEWEDEFRDKIRGCGLPLERT